MGRGPAKYSPGEKRSMKARLEELELLRYENEYFYPGIYDHEINALRSVLNEDPEE